MELAHFRGQLPVGRVNSITECHRIGTRSPVGRPGSRLALEIGGRRQILEPSTAPSCLSASEAAVVVEPRTTKLEITWPSGKVQLVEDLPSEGKMTVREPE